MNKTILRTALATLAVFAITTNTAQAQGFGNGAFRGAINGATQRAGRGPIMQKIFDFATIYGQPQRRSNMVLPQRDSAISSMRTPISSWGTLSDNRPLSRTTLSRQQNMRPTRSYSRNGMEFIPQTRPVPNTAPYVAPNFYHGGLLP